MSTTATQPGVPGNLSGFQETEAAARNGPHSIEAQVPVVTAMPDTALVSGTTLRSTSAPQLASSTYAR